MTLTEFLLARIAEDEELWTFAREADLAFTVTGAVPAVPPQGFVERMLADCEARRRIVMLHHEVVLMDKPYGIVLAETYCAECSDVDRCETLCSLALPHAAHPDYREEWRP